MRIANSIYSGNFHGDIPLCGVSVDFLTMATLSSNHECGSRVACWNFVLHLFEQMR